MVVSAAWALEAFPWALLKSCCAVETGIGGLHHQSSALSKMGPARSLVGSSTLQVLTHRLSLTQSPVLVAHCMPNIPVTNLDSAWTFIFTVSQSDFQTSCEGKTVIEKSVFRGPHIYIYIYEILYCLTCADNTSNWCSVAGFVSEGSVCTLGQSWLHSTAFNLIDPGVPVAETILVLGGERMGSSTVKLSARHWCVVEIPGFAAQRAPLVLLKVLHSSRAAVWPASQPDVACKQSFTCDARSVSRTEEELCGGSWGGYCVWRKNFYKLKYVDVTQHYGQNDSLQY